MQRYGGHGVQAVHGTRAGHAPGHVHFDVFLKTMPFSRIIAPKSKLGNPNLGPAASFSYFSPDMFAISLSRCYAMPGTDIMYR
eukprot:1225499-Rhodomonas_salina.2